MPHFRSFQTSLTESSGQLAPFLQRMNLTTIIFDVDDTLYDVGTGFTAHRNGEAVQQFMVDQLGFADLASAKTVRDEYFERYHATAKALVVAEKEGRFPPMDNAPETRFHARDLSEYWAKNLNFSLLGGSKSSLREDLESCPLHLVAFSNGPRKYVKRVLEELDLFSLFGESRLFAVDDVLPSCKPEVEAFSKVLESVGAKPEQCVMVEDSMKNIRVAKQLGMKTILITGKKTSDMAALEASEATKPGDAPMEDDPAVDVAMETVEELRSRLPGLWKSPACWD